MNSFATHRFLQDLLKGAVVHTSHLRSFSVAPYVAFGSLGAEAGASEGLLLGSALLEGDTPSTVEATCSPIKSSCSATMPAKLYRRKDSDIGDKGGKPERYLVSSLLLLKE